MTDYTDDANRLRVQWTKGRGMYESFFHGLEEVQKDIGPEALPDWCFNDLKIGLSVINRTAAILKANDEARVKDALRPARNIVGQVKKLREYEEAEKEKKQIKEKNKIASERRKQFINAARAAKTATALQYMIAECDAVNEGYMVALGKRYAEIKRAVEDSGAAGTDPNGVPWTWKRWAPIHLGETMGRINLCILSFEENAEQREEAA